MSPYEFTNVLVAVDGSEDAAGFLLARWSGGAHDIGGLRRPDDVLDHAGRAAAQARREREKPC
jgi:hypothetical protein